MNLQTAVNNTFDSRTLAASMNDNTAWPFMAKYTWNLGGSVTPAPCDLPEQLPHRGARSSIRSPLARGAVEAKKFVPVSACARCFSVRRRLNYVNAGPWYLSVTERPFALRPTQRGEQRDVSCPLAPLCSLPPCQQAATGTFLVTGRSAGLLPKR